jgi:hypothetical protein
LKIAFRYSLWNGSADDAEQGSFTGAILASCGDRASMLLGANMSSDVARVSLPTDNLVPLESVLLTEELDRRPSRPPDFETEHRALMLLVRALVS